jgi:antitoxin component YwqK of YwqJK toxin-antitoxin module
MEGRKNQNKNNDGVWIYYDENGVEAKRIFYIDGKKLDN